METDTQVATWDQIVYRFQQIPSQHWLAHNWGTSPQQCRDEWDVNAETYINGIPLIVDRDYEMGYLLEVVDRTKGTVSYGVVVLFHGGKYDGTKGEWSYEHDSMQYEPVCGTFFERTEDADSTVVGQWAVETIHELMRAHSEARRKR